MKHPRTLIRKHLANELVRLGAWGESVFINRVAPIDGDDVFPNICIYTPTERTKQAKSGNSYNQELHLTIDVRSQRPDGRSIADAGIGGADEILDDACMVIEQIIISNYSNKTLRVDGYEIRFSDASEINTEITHSGSGDVPHMLATIEFRLIYEACYEPLPVDTCPLALIFGEIKHMACLEQAVGINSLNEFGHPDYEECN